MADEKIKNTKDELERLGELAINNSGDVAGSMPQVGTENEKAIIKEELMNEAAARIARSKGTQIQSIIFTRPSLKEILVEGENARGHIADPEKVLANFVTKFGVVDDGSGNVTFANAQNPEAAQTLYNELKAAVADPTKTFPVYLSKGTASIRGAKLKVPGEEQTQLFDYNELVQYLLFKAAAQVFFDTATQTQIQVGEARNNRRSSLSDGKGKGKAEAKNIKKIAVLKVANRKDENNNDRLLSRAVYCKNIKKDEVDENASGAKSVLSAQYRTTNKKGEQKVQTYRIPLVTAQYKIVIDDDELKSKFNITEGSFGATVQVKTFEGEGAAEELANFLEKSVLTAIKNNFTEQGGDDLKTKLDTAKAAAAKADANEIGDTL